MAWQAVVAVVTKVWAVIKVVGAVYSIYTVWSMKNKGNESPTYGWDIETQCSNELPVPIIYGGPNKVAGNIVWQETSSDNQYLYMFVALSEGEIESIEDVRANDISFSELSGSSYTAYLGTKDQELDIRCWGVWVPDQGHYEYDSTLERDVWVVDVPAHWEGQWQDGLSKVGSLRNVAYLAITIKAGEKISGGTPNITAIVKGRKVRVWENEAWTVKYSDNPAWCMLDLMTNFRYGGGYLDSLINMESFKNSAAYCDELIWVDDGTTAEYKKRFTLGLVVDWQASLIDITDQIRMACRGYVASRNGQVSFLIEQPTEVVQDFTMDHIVPNSLQITIPGKDDVWDLVQVTYIDPDQNYAKIPAQSIDESNPVFPTKKEFTVVGVNRFDQASRLAYFYRMYSKHCGLAGKFKTTIRALNRTAGDVITLTEDVMGWAQKPVRIYAIRHAANHTHEIYFREYNNTIYTDILGSAKPTLNYSTRPNPFAAPPDPTDVKLEESSFILKSGEVITEINVSFAPGNSFYYSHTEIVMSEDDSGIWKNVGPADGNLAVHGLKIGVTYNFQFKTVTKSGVKSAGVTQSITTVGKSYPPVIVTGLTVVQNEYNRAQIILSWQPNDPEIDPDLKGYEARVGDSGWEVAAKVTNDIIVGTSCTYTAPANGHYKFYVKAIDNSGNYSTGATTAEITVIIVPSAPTGLTAEQDAKDRSQLIIPWTASPGKDIAEYQLKYGNDGWDAGTAIAETKETSYKWTIPASGTYNIMVRAVTVAGNVSNIANVLTAPMTEPDDVTGFKATQSATDHTLIRLSWDAPASLDVSYYVIKKSNWDTGEIVSSCASGVFFDVTIADESQHTYLIKAVSRAGKESRNPAIVSNIFSLNPSPVSAIQAVQSTSDKSVLNIMWSGVLDGDLRGYQVKIDGNYWDSAEALPETKELYTTYKLTKTGNIKIMIKTVNTAGFYSDEVSISYYAKVEPEDIAGLVAYQNGENVELYWDKPTEPDVIGFEITEGASFDMGQVVATGLTVNEYSVKVDTERQYLYHVKAINRSGHYGLNAASASLYVANLPPKNVIQEYDEISLQTGTHDNTEFGESLLNFQTFGGKWSDYPTTKFSDVGGSTVLKLKSLVEFSRDSTAYKSDGTLVEVNQPRIEDMTTDEVAVEGTTNLLTENQASVETDTTGFNQASGGATLSRSSNWSYHGLYSLEMITNDTATSGWYIYYTSFTSGITYTFRCRLKGEAGTVLCFQLASNFYYHTCSGDVDLFVQTFSVTATTPAIGCYTGYGSSPQGIYTVYFDCLQLEQKDHATDFTIGTRNTVYKVLPYGKCLWVEEATTNLIPVAKQKFVGWDTYGGATVVLTQNQIVSEWGCNDATRIQTSGGTSTSKYYFRFSAPSVNGQKYATCIYIKNTSSVSMAFNNNFSNITIGAGETKKVEFVATGNGISYLALIFIAANISDSLDFIAWHPMAETKACCTTFHDTSRAAESLTMSTTGLSVSEGTIEGIVEITDVSRRSDELSTPRVFHLAGNGEIRLYHHNGGDIWYLRTSDGINANVGYAYGTSLANGFYYYKVPWNTDIKAEFWNLSTQTKSLEMSIDTPCLPTILTSLNVGSSGTANFASTRFGKHRLSNIARTDDPDFDNLMPVDGHTTAVLNIGSSLDSYLGAISAEAKTVLTTGIFGRPAYELSFAAVYLETGYGVYQTTVKDMGQVITANITSQFISTVILKGVGSAILQIRTSQDNTTWTSWTDFKPAQYTFRYLEARVLLATTDISETPEVNRFTIKIDVPDTDIAKTATIAAGGTTVEYGHTYYTVPVVTPTAVGEDLHAQLISKTISNCVIKVKNASDTDVGGQVDLRIKGY